MSENRLAGSIMANNQLAPTNQFQGSNPLDPFGVMGWQDPMQSVAENVARRLRGWGSEISDYLAGGPAAQARVEQGLAGAEQTRQDILAHPEQVVVPAEFEAYHGTAATFERFLDEFMGTGQGAQTYGWGHYVAGEPTVAEAYRRMVPKYVPVDEAGQPISGLDLARKYYEPGSIAPSWGGSYDRVLAFNEDPMTTGLGRWSVNVQSVVPDWDKIMAEPQFAGKNQMDVLNSGDLLTRPDLWKDNWRERPRWHASPPDDLNIKAVGQARGWPMEEQGGLLNVQVKPDHDDFLDWDLPYSEQHHLVQNKLDINFPDLDAEHDNLTGQQIYNRLISKQYGDPFLPGEDEAMSASKELDAAGIPGMRFLDQFSRGPTRYNSEYTGPEEMPGLVKNAWAARDVNRFGSVEDIKNNLTEFEQKQAGTPLATPSMSMWYQDARDWLDRNAQHFTFTKKPDTYNYVVYNPDNLVITHRNGRRLIPVDHDPFAQPTGTPLTP